MRAHVAPLATALVATAAAALAADAPPWRDATDLPLPEGANSVVITKRDQPIETEPSPGSGRRGSGALGARLPLFGAKRGTGCAARWLNVGPMAWVCQDSVLLDTSPAVDAGDRSLLTAPNGLPFRYFFVGREGSNGYLSLRAADETAPDQELQPGFALALVEQQQKNGEAYGHTHHGLWVPMRELGAVSPIGFHGEEIAGGGLDFAWVLDDRSPVFTKPDASARSAQTRTRFEKVAVLEEKKAQAQVFYRIGDGAWMRTRDVRRPTRSDAPPEVRPGDRWIDIELASQTLVAYDGAAPVYATLVSTGKGAQGTETATPKGTHRIWVKLLSTNMDNLEDEDAERFYAIEDVPYVQFFSKGVGLHAAFWHRGFGRVRSHGCVNLAPLDAQRLFAFTGPRLPAGWTAALPTAVDEGTVVRVR